MGFWGGLGKLIAGKPVFEAPKQQDEANTWDDDAPTIDHAEERRAKREAAKGLYDDAGIKQIPEAGVERVKHIISGDYVEVWAHIVNHSTRVIELDKITLCNQTKELDYPLQPGGSREFSVYKGQALSHDHYTKAQLYYKDVQTGDYFRADHVVEYDYDAHSKHYHVNALELIRPIHDV